MAAVDQSLSGAPYCANVHVGREAWRGVTDTEGLREA